MSWKKNYLASLIELGNADDGQLDNRELLALFEIERRLHATIKDFIEAMDRVRNRETDTSTFNHLLQRRHLRDLFALAYVDASVSEMEQEWIDRYIAQSELEPHEIQQLREEGMAKAGEILQQAVKNHTPKVD